MPRRIEIITKVNDTRSDVMKQKLVALGYSVDWAKVADVYTVNKDLGDMEKVTEMLANPVTQMRIGIQDDNVFAIEIGFLPGVTDNIGNTAKESIEATMFWNIHSNPFIVATPFTTWVPGTGFIKASLMLKIVAQKKQSYIDCFFLTCIKQSYTVPGIVNDLKLTPKKLSTSFNIAQAAKTITRPTSPAVI